MNKAELKALITETHSEDVRRDAQQLLAAIEAADEQLALLKAADPAERVTLTSEDRKSSLVVTQQLLCNIAPDPNKHRAASMQLVLQPFILDLDSEEGQAKMRALFPEWQPKNVKDIL